MNRLVAERCRPIWNPEAANECRSLCNWTYSKWRPIIGVTGISAGVVRDPKHISTSYVERHNWTVRISMRRYTRLSNGFSRKVENHAAAVALNYFSYNFIQIHRTLRTSPAMAAGVTDKLRSVADLVALWESEEQEGERAA